MAISETLLTKEQTERIMRAMSIEGKVPGRGREVTVTHADGGTSTFSPSKMKGPTGRGCGP